MLTIQTQAAISILHAVASMQKATPMDKLFTVNIVSELLGKLEAGKIIKPIAGKNKRKVASYELTRPMSEISLLDILEATGEHLNCNHPNNEEFYMRYTNAAQKLGVINQMTRLYLENIKLNDL